MATKGQIIAGVTLAGIGGLAAASSYAAKRRRSRRAKNNCAPYRWDATPVVASIDQLLDEGADDRDEIARVVATEHFGIYPGGGEVVFPPVGSPPKGVSCVWQKTVELVDIVIDERGGFSAKPHEIIAEWQSPEGNPRPGSLYYQPRGQVYFGNTGIVATALRNAGVPDNTQNRIAYLRFIECSPWNDALYNVELSDTALAQRFRTSPRRGISQNPQHSDNIMRMSQGLPPRRAAIETSMTAHQGGGHHAFMWLPLIEPGAQVPVIAAFPDGRSGINPPAEILAFGLENVTPRTYGCEEYGNAANDLAL